MAKLRAPALPRGIVPRPALWAALDAGAGAALTLVCAPPGFGKTVLLADWVRATPQMPTAWVSLDPDDDDPRRLWSAVLAALRPCPAVPADSMLHRLVVPRGSVEPGFFAEFLDALDALPTQVRLVLDDVHHLRAGPSLQGLQMLVRSRTRGVRLVLASRMDPGLPLPRLRLEDRLCELRADQLRFSLEDAGAFLERCGLPLAREQVVLLHERTGGWAAGLRLAALSARGRPDVHRFVSAFTGDERPVADYLVSEVLDGIDEDRREILRRTSLADPVPAGLAVALCEREDAVDVLDTFADDLGIVSVTGPERADYHLQELLRSYLLAELRRKGAGVVAGLHARAARWWEARGRPVEALGHAAQSGEPAVLAKLLPRRAAELCARGEHAALLTAVETVAGEWPGTEAWTAAVAAFALLARGELGAAAEGVRTARRRDRVPEGSDLDVFLTAIGRLAGRGTRVGVTEPVPQDAALAALALAGRGAAALTAGAARVARSDLEAALARARELGLALLELQCRCLLAAAAWTGGDQRTAAAAAAGAVTAAHAGGWADTVWSAGAHAISALAALDRGRAEAALEIVAACWRTAPAERDPVVRFALGIARGGALFDTGAWEEGLRELQHSRAELGETALPTVLAARAALLEHRLALWLGHATAAAAAASWISARSGVRCERTLVRAWAESAAGRTRSARATVAPLRAPGVRPALPITVVEAWLVEAGAALEDGDRPAARHALRVALTRAERLDAVRPFALAAPGVRSMLVDTVAGTGDRNGFAARALAAQRPDTLPPAPELTPREREVLARLPSLLNLDEIAVDLSVSVNTIKSHVRSIYGKLGVGTRRTAVLAAHEHGLLV